MTNIVQIPAGYVQVTAENLDQYSKDRYFIPGGKYWNGAHFKYSRSQPTDGCVWEPKDTLIAPEKSNQPKQNMKLQDLRIPVPNKTIAKIVEDFLKEKGFNVVCRSQFGENIEWVLSKNDDGIYWGNKASHDKSPDYKEPLYKVVTLEELFSADIPPKPIKVKLNDEYAAEVGETIKVGCQEFPLTILDDLVKARAKYVVAAK